MGGVERDNSTGKIVYAETIISTWYTAVGSNNSSSSNNNNSNQKLSVIGEGVWDGANMDILAWEKKFMLKMQKLQKTSKVEVYYKTERR